MKRRKDRAILLLMAASASVVISTRLFAAPDGPVINGSTATFSGNQQYGIRSSRDFSSPPVTQLEILMLNAWIHPYDTGHGVELYCKVGNGGNGGVGHSGGHGQYGLDIGINLDVGVYGIETVNGYALYAASLGGNGGSGHDGGLFVPAGNGGWGRPGGAVHIDLTATDGGRWPPPLITSSAGNHGIYALSKGGQGGNGGTAYVGGDAGAGGAGGNGGKVDIIGRAGVKTQGEEAHGLFAASLGGASGKAGNSYGIAGGGGDAGSSGKGGPVSVDARNAIETTGNDSHGILAQSIGGFAPGAGGGGGLVTWGGSNGASGNGDSVTVGNLGSVTTHAANSYAIFGQSIGGGGGNASSTAGLVAIGGSGSSGGSGNAVSITNQGSLTTEGENSLGISAQSIGGGGGAGAATLGGFSLGGSGGSGGNGSTVNVQNPGTISTAGDRSDGIFAQSIGGGGGRAKPSGGEYVIGGSGGGGGSGGDVTISNDGGVNTAGLESCAILVQSIGGGGGRGASTAGIGAIGGKGGSGGSGGTLSITNKGTLGTHGDSAVGVFAQSIGGGGGTGGGSLARFSIGGSGNVGGEGGGVSVQNEGVISTAGNHADSVFAQSIGGGGGSGRSAIGNYSIGGSGGTAGSGGNVNVMNVGSLSTTGFDSIAVFAQSTGGGGGRGGGAYSFGAFGAVAFGGTGAKAGHGGQVDVMSVEARTITTVGDMSHGIFAQSLGGGGGSGGDALSAAVGVVATASLAIGGAGGGGGNGGIVNLSSQSQVATYGRQAHALFAQSIGGGGGSGGDSAAFSATIPAKPGKSSVTFTVSIGGTAGNGGNGGAVTVNTFGGISTAQSDSIGIFAQSVGGGGGRGGSCFDGIVACDSMVLSMALGGHGGWGGYGDAVSVYNNATIATKGQFSHGILSQSIGGGGGSGGNAATFILDPVQLAKQVSPSPGDFIQLPVSIDTTLGGSGGFGGAGGAIDLSNNVAIATEGVHAHGVVAQSIGGGGGNSGQKVTCDFSVLPQTDVLQRVAGCVGLNTTITIGSTVAGSGGNGGVIEATNAASVVTKGDFANGLLAQSIGGGGGTAVAAVEDTYGLIGALISPMTVKRSQAANGNGGAVTVSSARFPQDTTSGVVEIRTSGGFAHGILAQSVAGGGGYAGISEKGGISTLQDYSPTAAGASISGKKGLGSGFAGSAGGTGNSDAVTVNCAESSILTSGYMSHGIFAQSAAGVGSAGAVTVNLITAQIKATGADSHGVLAQSVGGAGRGDILIQLIEGSTVVGGTGAGAGVFIDGGANNKLASAGSVSAASGVAIVATAGNNVVDNTGTITGDVILGAGANSFNNQAGATFNAGSRIELGHRQTLTNAGTLSPGGPGAIATSTLVGDLVQLPSGVVKIELGGAKSFDRINVVGVEASGGLVTLDGCLEVSCINGFMPKAGQTFEILGVDQSDITGQFAACRGLRLSAGSSPVGPMLFLEYSYLDGAVRLTAKKAMTGDANLDGVINASDYAIIDNNFVSQSHDSVYGKGDFNLDGVVNADDYFLIDAAFISSGKLLSVGHVAVPEPITIDAAFIAKYSPPSVGYVAVPEPFTIDAAFIAKRSPPSVRYVAVPEPFTFGLFALAAASVCLGRRRA
ncbi:MAG: dockerin type I repeat-containing protein [Planctomycetota bacterium]|nr:dockerin type I repeat-containing protein [Planctomycetota bacterium]